jgi:hypothetical protein
VRVCGIVKADTQKFDALLGRLIKAEPQKRSETKRDEKCRPKRAAQQGVKTFSSTIFA